MLFAPATARRGIVLRNAVSRGASFPRRAFDRALSWSTLSVQRFNHLFGGVEWSVELAFRDLLLAFGNGAIDETGGEQRPFSPFFFCFNQKTPMSPRPPCPEKWGDELRRSFSPV